MNSKEIAEELIFKLENRNTGLEDDIEYSLNEGKIVALQSLIDTAKAVDEARGDLPEKIDKAQYGSGVHNQTIDQCALVMAKYKARIKEFEKNEKGYRISVDELYRQGETLRQQIAELEKTKEQLSQEIMKNVEVEKENEELSKAIISGVKSVTINLPLDSKNFGVFEALENKIIKLKQENEELKKKRVELIKAKMNCADDCWCKLDINKLQQEVTKLKEEIEEQATDIIILNAKNQQFQSKIKELQNENNQLKEALDEWQGMDSN